MLKNYTKEGQKPHVQRLVDSIIGNDTYVAQCVECVYRHVFEEQNLMKLGAMFCHSDVINFGNLPYTDFKRTKTLCQGGDCCDFDFIRHDTDAGDGWERSKSV